MLCAIDFSNLHTILRSLYDEMMPLCSDMAGVAQGIAGLGALFYVAYRIWRSLAAAEPVDVFPLLRPFAIGLCIMFFPLSFSEPSTLSCLRLCRAQPRCLKVRLSICRNIGRRKDRLEYEAMMKDPSTAYLVDDAEFDRQIDELGVTEIGTAAGMYIERGMYKVKKAIQNFFRELLEMLFQAASLTIDTIRTFFLIVLAILGPIAFALSVWDGFQSTLTTWIQRYIQTYLWLPVADLFSTILAKIQVLMLQNDISELTNNPNVNIDGSNICYIIFMVIGIVGYFTIPTVSGWIIQAGGAGNYNRAVNNTTMQAGSMAGSIAGGVAGNVAGRAGKLLK